MASVTAMFVMYKILTSVDVNAFKVVSIGKARDVANEGSTWSKY
jgi:hypothetical protein